MKKLWRLAIALFLAGALAPVAEAETPSDWISLFDGRSLDGWRASENEGSWRIQEGAIVAKGPRSHLFYVGPNAPFENFHFKCEVMTRPGSNSGIYFHTRFQDAGWPRFGYEAQVNNTGRDPKRTGSLYGVVDVSEAAAEDNQWFREEVIVQGKRIQIIVNGKTLVDFTELPDRKPGKTFTRILSQGTFALQAHDAGSEVHYRNIQVKKLP
ncbi:MAG: DUF1080 domain-containing protein [Planctomycetales bacterium]|nr:DUF1080 domain-containing protein [Planctomycetales bacterium]NIM09648.1 DUF1080 domain-containing protein [Planctomycetales bacterium]NIN09131.1 DUF1080 domain-containing protein [Planctomycetales bacterium]NIN78238.1 DUF1080 domain-containing protein [Planctomycetales bacterium]NIO35429.1 DUF1080 domain-containing protein [Planctomycetales bacterium]